MVLLAGVTGSGKSTTIASMLNWINHNYRKHILTLEDPIEFVFTEDKCLINQREIGMDVKDFGIGMKHAVREDPDVMLVGEMRDEETFMTAIHAAETGHLVFGTIHASSAASTIGRILDLFPQDMHPALRSAIAMNMKAIVAQKLLPSIKPGVGRVPTVEIMTFNPTIRKLLLEENDEKLADAIRMCEKEGMQDFTMSLEDLVDRELIDRATAFEVAPNVDALKMALKGISVAAARDSLMNRLRWILLAVVVVAVLQPAQALAQTPFPEMYSGDAAAMPRGPGMYLSWIKIVVSCLVFVAWVSTADWVNLDCNRHRFSYALWNPANVFPFAIAFLVSFLIPFYAAGLSLMILAYLVPAAIYVFYRNARVGSHETVLTPDHLRFLAAERLRPLGIKIEAAVQAGRRAGRADQVDCERRNQPGRRQMRASVRRPQLARFCAGQGFSLGGKSTAGPTA